MPAAACSGMRFEGYCHSCRHWVGGTLSDYGSSDYVTVDGSRAALVGTKGYGDCGHETTVISGSSYITVDGVPVAMQGDQVDGTITGIITGGSDFVTI